jgi:hypothetical protein
MRYLSWRADAGIRLLFSIAFAVALSQESLYFANQNTKYLHGAAAGGYGWLADDWMAQTVDPLPVFSVLVKWLFELGVPELSYAIFALLAVVWAWALTSIVGSAGLIRRERAHVVTFMAGLILTQAVLAKWPRGLASQYLHDHYLQPGVFGVLLMAGIAQSLKGRTVAAIVLVVSASVVHSDYLPTTGACILAFIVGATKRSPRASRRAIYQALLALVLIAPLAIQLRAIATPTSPETWRRALDILVAHIPEHTAVAQWFDLGSAGRLAVMALGAWLARDLRLRLVMWSLFAVIVGSMAIVVVFGSELVAAVTPWRASILLMPLSIAVIVARGVARLVSREPQHEGRVLLACASFAIAAVALGLWRQGERWSAYADAESMPPIRWVQDHDRRPELYLIPSRDSDFDRFRLETGQPILINWKTHPYKDVEVIEWSERLQEVDRFYSAGSADEACRQLGYLRARYGVSAVVYAISHPVANHECPLVEEAGRAGQYVIARLGALR